MIAKFFPRLPRFFKRNFATNLPKSLFDVSAEVENALRGSKGVVALESTVITHGLPYPKNLEVAKHLENVVRSVDAVPATIALIDGKIRVGLSDEELEFIARPEGGAVKVSLRDICNVLADQKIGGTTVAATMWIANQVGVKVFATGGIGGVHRGAEDTFDISADLTVLGTVPVAVVCAGAKSILDVGKTLEVMETNNVNVIAYSDDNFFPGFFTSKTKHRTPFHTTSLEKIADILAYGDTLNLQNGTLIACPLPEKFAKNGELIERCIETSINELKEAGNISSKDVTPFILKRVNELSGSLSMQINISLLENNARIAAKLAKIYSKKSCGQRSPIYESSARDFTTSENRKKPNVLCIGATILDMEFSSEVDRIENRGGYYPGKMFLHAGGVARNHADALTRLGCDVSFVSVVGDDVLQEILCSKCNHMNWSNVAKIPSHRTATSMGINVSGNIQNGFIDLDELMEHLSPKMIESRQHLFSEADFVLVDGNLSTKALNCIFEIVEHKNKQVWFEPTNYLKVSKIFGEKNLWRKISAISPNANEFRVLCEHLHIPISEGAFKSAESLRDHISKTTVVERLFADSLSRIVVSLDRRGSVFLERTEDGNFSFFDLPSPKISSEQIVSVSGAGDCFNCGLLAGRLNNLSREKSLEIANLCALESLKSMDSVPHTLADIARKFFKPKI